MNETLFSVVLFLLIIQTNCHAGQIKDKRLTKVTPEELQQIISTSPLESQVQYELIVRSSQSHIIDKAYNDYTLIWKQKQNDPYANLLRGIAAENYQSESMDSANRNFYPARPKEDLFKVAGSCLTTATRLAPKSALIKMEYGFYLWQFGNQEMEGLKLLHEAIALSPDDPRLHARLGFVCMNPYSKAYDMKQAVRELQQAAKLDPTYAFPHELLANIYQHMNRPEDAQHERAIYQNLVPS